MQAAGSMLFIILTLRSAALFWIARSVPYRVLVAPHSFYDVEYVRTRVRARPGLAGEIYFAAATRASLSRCAFILPRRGIFHRTVLPFTGTAARAPLPGHRHARAPPSCKCERGVRWACVHRVAQRRRRMQRMQPRCSHCSAAGGSTYYSGTGVLHSSYSLSYCLWCACHLYTSARFSLGQRYRTFFH